MRISDWSSDVCSSALTQEEAGQDARRHDNADGGGRRPGAGQARGQGGDGQEAEPVADRRDDLREPQAEERGRAEHPDVHAGPDVLADDCGGPRRSIRVWGVDPGDIRSEEHTSELQSPMRISYAVYGLKKKKNT